MRKIITAAVLVGALALGMTACSSTTAPTSSHQTKAAAAAPKPANLVGDWKQNNSKSTDSYQSATITANTIAVYWVSDGGSTKSLYWAGTFTAPTAAGSYSWTSKNDTSQTSSALLASSDPTKTFTYADGVISYSVSALGTTTTVKLAPAK